MSDDKVTANDSKTLRLFPTVGNAVQGLDGARFPRWEIRVNMMYFKTKCCCHCCHFTTTVTLPSLLSLCRHR